MTISEDGTLSGTVLTEGGAALATVSGDWHDSYLTLTHADGSTETQPLGFVYV